MPHLIETFVRHRVEGLIYVAEYHQQVHCRGCLDDAPMVLTNCFDDRSARRPFCRTTGAASTTWSERLIVAGHERIAYLTLRDDIVATGLRKAGYRDALSEARPAHDAALVQCCEIGSPEGETQVLATPSTVC